ncbi:hypothetical protein A1Q5_17625 [Aliivibrio logei 5S-186]|uniref:MATE family efflux transporter n=1 Tax=Aliivibrio logei 5S-186 TaxID=626086 RepID=A0ABX3AXH6_ALILO|nr:hypothetical protein A1Q5_17625 [Aliivibrio logei 5S-186]
MKSQSASFFRQVMAHSRGDFFHRLIIIALPITLQSILLSSKSLIDVFMLGQLSEAVLLSVLM